MTLPETASSRWAAAEGLPFPLGPTRIEEEDAYNFALYSKHAESVTLLLFTDSDIVNPVAMWSLCVVSDGSKKLEADIPVGYTASLFSKPPQSGMADYAQFAIM